MMASSILKRRFDGVEIKVGVEESGQGPLVLLLPALSSISTRQEMRPLQQRLAAQFRTMAIDWPGFGDFPRPALDWRPEIYSAFLAFVLESVVTDTRAVVAAGHAATYALMYAAAHAQSFRRLVLVAPTWRGPLPTVMGGERPFFARLRRLVDLPAVGALLYKLNVNRVMVRRMGAGHVYVDPGWLQGERLREKLAVTRARGARYASVRFVTGRLDPLASREAFLDLARRAGLPMLLVYGASTPSRSRAEMEALAAIPGVQTAQLAHGKLALHEEFPDDVAEVITAFLAEG